ncbi:hypothetical protein CLAFUW4_10219 [Fulvia fulva]|uniref:Uncharacterized protein n=1 Tax=Passalora fulva TaxID=5499 RepID=A0A9Q8LF10_PASFU|nr:uncharacterized protein CLAFUR5_04833 [Fulvia fulva]KAK4616007.1 hypothetical protein CLAFUR4_10223 [Fulvia fulva]KAK4616700.1 hypothetical protein CLAFUR0_10221 [Fulvia fulva]UJO16182.1 hypothetical protein CLAFUR5_04833 [Fulvia fulva]WPV19315.1 hypothetical protein CLAFUW4_10219 [Fulvia fulva]WPV34596.1 hypothetical protein CLAFUW7_10219 [Fulvia fulva]
MAKSRKQKRRERAKRELVQYATFECAVCLETSDCSTGISILEDQVCTPCFVEEIIPQFHTAERTESQYPVKWGGKEVKLTPYRL